MDAPTAEALRTQSRLLQTLYPSPPGATDELTRLTAEAVSLVLGRACMNFPSEVPSGKEAVATRAFRLKTEELAIGADPARLQKAIIAAGSGGLRSISAGSWSESYFGPADLLKAGQLSANPALHEALRALMSDECWHAFLAEVAGNFVPFSQVVQPRYRSRRRHPLTDRPRY